MIGPIRMVLLAVFTACLTTHLQAESVPVKPKVLFIGIDGCRHDAVVAADTPHIDMIVGQGTRYVGTDILSPQRTDSANTISGPGWSNLLTGVWPDKHQVLDNKFTKPNYKDHPHFFSLVKQARPELKTASFSDWEPIAAQILRDSDHTVNLPAKGAEDYSKKDIQLTEACCEHLKTSEPDVVFLYLGQVDERGHAYGFHPTVKEYTSGIENVDRHIGQVVAAIQSRPNKSQEDWLILIGTDHGGAGTDHGDGHSNPDIRRTFLIVSGPSAQANAEQTQTYQVDIVATALTHLGIELRPEWMLDGRAVGLKLANGRAKP